ncbi:MAG TPA: MoxR family ATPase [Candidatus Limivivens merdigallinarum]|uniref:MoxR family ATPase n=1 Tax=Candidatus Limivivens merdigallinarum TaxID=2840859 RepID=A0A9D0ZU52_9FIRM|nr:MoxR family ATPase [Candidatus Limivivens merdigallinarum]
MNGNKAAAIMAEVKKAVIGKDDCVEKILMAILGGGHVLMDDIPGVGKTTMALAFSRSCSLEENRMQFTPDVMPSDITGFSIYRKDTSEFVYQPGPIMCNLFLADEINRTSPKTQSALLEVMEEGNVTVDGVTREVPKPFIVIATQNPAGSSGTQMLPDSQLDRFMICTSMGYPDVEHEIEIIKNHNGQNPLENIVPVVNGEEILEMQAEVEQVFIHDVLYQYIAHLVAATREHPMLQLGVSPRGTIALTRMAKASAYLNGRNYVVPSDVSDVFKDVVIHRIMMNAKARVNHVTADGIIENILESVPKPVPGKRQG